MVVDTSLYDLLGVKPDADDRTIKKAFMVKARELHPDKNRDDPHATEKFQAVNEAYEVLKDPERRAKYDKFGPESLKDPTNSGDDIFSHLFGDDSIFGIGGRRSNRRQRTPDISHEIKCSLEDLFNGKEVTLKINHQKICPKCNGSGCAEGKTAKKCKDCDGRGQKVEVIRRGPMITQQISPCRTCNGTGQVIDPADQCKECKGNKVVNEAKKLVVHIERGMEDGDTIVFNGEADEMPGADTGDLVIIIRQKKHDTFIRHHDDLLIKKKITLTEALLGTKFVITHLDGRKLVVESPATQVICPGAVKTIDREGMPVRGNSFERGKLFIAFEVVFPKYNEITPELKNVLQKVLPAPDETKGIKMDDENVFEVSMRDGELQEFENAKKHYQESRHEAYNSGDGEDDRQGNVNCQPM